MAPRKVVKIFSGDIFGRLTVIEPVKNEKDPSHQYFLCKCECGNLKKICITDFDFLFSF